MNITYKENGGKKSFACKSKASISSSQCGKHDCSPNNKRMDIIMSIQVCLISLININYKENGGKKSFSSECKASISHIPKLRT